MMKHTPRIRIMRTDDGRWLAICYECGWHGDYAVRRTTAAVNGSAHAREAKR